jgi:hypothetical protein
MEKYALNFIDYRESITYKCDACKTLINLRNKSTKPYYRSEYQGWHFKGTNDAYKSNLVPDGKTPNGKGEVYFNGMIFFTKATFDTKNSR